ncbi:MAG: lactonase family protein [Ruminococcus sp.]
MPGKASCHIEKDEKGQRLFVSDYGSGDLKVIDISEAGSPKLLQEISFTGKGLDLERQEASHIHSCFLHRGDLYAADLGCDKIYSFGTDKGKLLQKETIEVRPGAGPRHMGILEKNGKTYLYVLNELDLTISVYCNRELCQTISLEEELPEGTLAAELCIAEEKMLYASVRGTGEIFGFTIDENGMLNLKQKVVVPKGWFRSICLDSSEKHLLAADQKTGKIYIFDRQSEGELEISGCLWKFPYLCRYCLGK